ncbi:hypothetical protein TNIN_301281 [Trichonephila inaurata madagascariensis]|uniref:BRF2-like C-terminal domain-containing protein n=1 Tax=Trichonephila inaurata madagascariensis TaxID=2747483 RepID=A0A8X6YEL2_9ARAC|nr:hypothetical protein TNIN_301281 [Trichonephila inaurata madagascariensis]
MTIHLLKDQICGTVEENIQCGLIDRKTETKENSTYFNHGLEILRRIFEIKLIDESTRHTIENLFKSIDREHYIEGEKNVDILVVACFLYIIRRHKDYARVTMTEMGSRIKCSPELLKEYLKFVEFYCNDGENQRSENVGIRNLEESVRKVLSSDGVRKLCQKYKVNEDNFLTTTLLLVKLADSCWIVTGRPLENVIKVCAYFGFMSVLQKLVLPFNRFCFQSGFGYYKCRERFAEVKRMILTLSKPLSRQALDVKTCISHISTILKESHILRNHLLGKVNSKKEFDRLEYALYRLGRLGRPLNKKLISKSVEATEKRFASNEIERKQRNENVILLLILNG